MRTTPNALALLFVSASCASTTPDTVARPQRQYILATPGGASPYDSPAETIGGKGRSEDTTMKSVVMIRTAPPPPPPPTTPRLRPPPH